MDFSYPPEAEQFRKELRSWLAANLTADVVRAGRNPGTDAETFDRLRDWNATIADAGWSAVSWPAAYGGRGASVLEQLVYVEETTRAQVPNPLNIIGISNIAPAIMQYGSEQQRRELLPRMLRADDIWCQGHLYLRRLLSWSALLGGSDPYLEDVGTLFVKSVLDAKHVGSKP